MNVLFLDIDGVLNGHQWMREAQSNNICRPCVLQLNRIIKATGCKIVLSSAWRYMIHGGAMKLNGFAYMLRTHGMVGLLHNDVMIGLTEPDEVCPSCDYRHKRRGSKVECKFGPDGNRMCIKCGASSTRGRQISSWLRRKGDGVEKYVVLDDDAFDFAERGHPFIQTNAKRGLTAYGADKVIAMLGRAKA